MIEFIIKGVENAERTALEALESFFQGDMAKAKACQEDYMTKLEKGDADTEAGNHPWFEAEQAMTKAIYKNHDVYERYWSGVSVIFDGPKHTPGPWKYEETVKPGRYEIRPAGRQVGSTVGYGPLAFVQGDKRVTGGDGLANARLMAAAPDLLEALRDMVSDHACLSEATLNFARAAISKATGEY